MSRRIHGSAGSTKLLTELDDVARQTIAAAGPRYSPGLNSAAPNLEIRSLQRAVDALSLCSGLRSRVTGLAGSLLAAYDRDHHTIDSLFAGRAVDFGRLGTDLDLVALGRSAPDICGAVMALRRHLNIVRKRINAARTEGEGRLRLLEAQKRNSDGDEANRARSQQRDRLQAKLSGLRRLGDALEEISDFANGHEGILLTQRNSILLLGEWGTGKTHFLCDVALQSLRDAAPTVVVLASSLRTDIDPLDAIAEATGLAPTGAELISRLEEAARSADRRGMILIVAINESDRDAWRRRLAGLVRKVSRHKHLGLVVSCRTPFDSGVVSEVVRKQALPLMHPGFVDREFDAQIEFFKYYNLPALHVPLLASEFSRPLFLRLMCEGITDLSKRSQKDKLRDIASGQKSMTYVLENFVKRAGDEVESKHQLPRNASWLIMKGEPRRGRPGFAGILAENRREWMSPDEAISQIQAFVSVSTGEAISVIQSMLASGLLIEHSRYKDGAYIDVLVLPYQRFSDHLVARHLLDTHLDISTEAKLRRCFYANRRLGSVFVIDQWGDEFSEPGIASALMIEFPERVRRLADRDGVRTELLTYLPRKRQLLYPFAEAFLEGLYWRPTSSFGADTRRLVELLLGRDDVAIRSRTYEVVVGLSTRPGHPMGVGWLEDRLRSMSMPERDLEWSEYLRAIEPESNVERLLAWAEREDHSKVDRPVAEHAARVISLLLTTTDRPLRDRATRALVLIGDVHPSWLFALTVQIVEFNDPYVSERFLAALFGACMRRWALERPGSSFADAVSELGCVLLELVLRPDAPFATWHVLTRGYAIGVLQILLKLRPRALSTADRALIVLSPGQAKSPFRPVSRIRKADIEDPEHAIHMDFGNYTIGRLVVGRANYDFKHSEYSGIRKQIADRMRRLGYKTNHFDESDRHIARYVEYRRDGHQVDRYGKKYSWIAYFEMYGLRAALGEIEDHTLHAPRPSDSDVDPTFPADVPRWDPPRLDAFESSPVEIHDWLLDGEVPDYVSLLRVSEVDGHTGDWVLLDASIREGVPDGRELNGWVSSIFAPQPSVQRLRAEVKAGRDLSDNGFPNLGADYYTFQGEIPWSPPSGAMYAPHAATRSA